MKDNTEKVYLEYSFLVPTDVWQSIYDFENSFSEFLSSKNLEGIVLNNLKGSVGFRRIVDIKKKQEPEAPQPPKTESTVTPADKLKQIAGESPNKRPEGKVRFGPINSFPQRATPKMQYKQGRRFVSRFK